MKPATATAHAHRATPRGGQARDEQLKIKEEQSDAATTRVQQPDCGIDAVAAAPSGMAAPVAEAFSLREHSAAVWPSFMVGQPEKPVRVIVVDDDSHVRRVIAQELMADARTLLVGEAGSLREGKRVVREHDFDVILVDLNLGDGRGYDLIAYVKKVRSSAEAIVVSVLEADEDAMRAFELGASGFLVKNSWFGSFVQSVLQVANGGASITPSLARRLLLRLERRSVLARLSDAGGQKKLTERERAILRMIAGGMTSTEIGGRLGISHMTVNTHVRNIYQKLQVRNRAQAVSCANSWGFF